MAKTQKLSWEEVRALHPEELPEKVEDWARYTFWHYTSLDAAEKILSGEKFLVNNIDRTNDLDEVQRYSGEQGKKVYALCFSNSDSESVPMWYLYAGLDGKGVAMGFTPSVMKEFICSIKAVRDEQTNEELRVGEDVEIQCGWVMYRKEKGGRTVFYRNKWATILNSIPERDIFFLKKYPWNYEREFRVVIIDKSGKQHNKLWIEFPKDNKMINKLKFRLAPEVTVEEAEAMKVRREKIEESALGIRMNLLERNKEAIKTYVRKHCIDLDRIIDNMLGF